MDAQIGRQPTLPGRLRALSGKADFERNPDVMTMTETRHITEINRAVAGVVRLIGCLPTFDGEKER